MPDIHIEAEYADGYVHREIDYDDFASPYRPGDNIFGDIKEKRPCAGHGVMVRFSLMFFGKRYDVDWRKLPENAVPIREMRKEQKYELATMKPIGDTQITQLRFGYYYIDNNNERQEEVYTFG